jgi:hypothetical protein
MAAQLQPARPLILGCGLIKVYDCPLLSFLGQTLRLNVLINSVPGEITKDYAGQLNHPHPYELVIDTQTNKSPGLWFPSPRYG